MHGGATLRLLLPSSHNAPPRLRSGIHFSDFAVDCASPKRIRTLEIRPTCE